MMRQLYEIRFQPARVLIVSTFCLLSMFVNVAEAVSQESESERPLPGCSFSFAHLDVIAESDTLDLPYSEPVPETNLKTGGEFVETFTWLYIGYYTFTSESMSETYGPGWLGAIEGVGWGKHFGGGIELGFFGGKGTPPLIDSDWVVNSSSIKMTTLFLGINALYSFKDTSDSGFFRPYVGLGPTLWFGWERIVVDASRSRVGFEEEFYAELLGLGLAYGGSAMIGTSMHINKFSLMVEARGVLSSSGSVADMISEEDEEAFNSSLYSVVERPDFNFTGWRIDFGIQW